MLSTKRASREKNNRFGSFVVRFRWLIILVTLLVTGFCTSGARFLSISDDYRAFFDGDNPELLAFEELQNTYTKNDNVLFAIAPKNGEVFTNKTLKMIEELTTVAWQIPYSIRVDSITNFQHTTVDGDDLEIEDLVVDAEQLSPAELKKIKKIALAEPLLLNRSISPTAHVAGINVKIQLQETGKHEMTEIVTHVRKLADDFRRRYPDIKIYLSGMVMMNNAFVEASQEDGQTLVPAMFLVVILVTFILTRSITGTVTTFLVILFSAAAAMGLAGWSGIVLTGPTMSAPTIILTLAVADCVHILISMFHEMRKGSGKHQAIIESIRINMQPVFLTSFTTAIGFLSMNFSDAPPFRDLGNIVAAGVMLAWINAVFFLPALMAVLPVRVRAVQHKKRLLVDSIGELVVKKSGTMFWGMVALVALLSFGITKIELNDVFTEYFDDRYEFRTHTDFILANLTGIYTISYSLGAGESNGINGPAYLKRVEQFANWYRQQPGVLHVDTITDILKRLNRDMHGGDVTYFRVPERQELAAQYLLLYEMSVPFGLDLNDQINVDKSATRFTATLKNLSTKEVLALEKSAQLWLKTNGLPSMFTYGASPTIMFANIADRNVISMLSGTVAALVVISLVLIIAMKSLKIGIISLAPNLIPAAMGFGVWGYIYGQVGMALSVVVAMTLGIVVDDTVHFLSKYLRARREHNMSAEEAVIYSFHTVGTAIIVTSLILVAGFSVLSTSGFEINAGMGKLTAITIVLALLADLLLLPPLLLKLEEKK